MIKLGPDFTGLMTLQSLIGVPKKLHYKVPPNGNRRLPALYFDIIHLADLPDPCQILSEYP